MKRSERILLTVLAVSLGVFVILPGVWKVVSGPVTEQRIELEAAESQLQKANDSFDISIARIKRMVVFKEQSLSSNSSQGALAYQQWLTDQAEIVAGFSNPEVGPERISLSRDKTYVAVRMRVTGEGTVEQLRRFLYRFHRANVLHRLVSLTVEAKNNSTNPRVSIRLLAEALSLRDAPIKGATLFARTKVATVNEDSPGLLTVASNDGFPEKAPFEIRIGDTYHQVVDVTTDGWQIAIAEDQEIAFSADDLVEFSPIHPNFRDATEDQFDAMIKLNPFAKPAPYQPRLDLIGTKIVNRGATLELTAKATGFDLTAGDPVFEVTSELPAGMTLADGKLTWAPTADLEADDYTVAIRATAAGLREPLEAEFTLTLKNVNRPPQLEIPDGLVASLGQAMSFQVSATDDETATDALRYALTGEVPNGAEIDAETGEVNWTPPADLTPGTVTIAIQVKDDGDPAQAVVVPASVEVQDDRALFTYLTSSVAADGDRQAWLYDRSTDKRVILREGGQLEYAGFDAFVLSIGDNFVLLQQDNDTLRLKIGKNLRQAEVVARLEPKPAQPPVLPDAAPVKETGADQEPAAAPATDSATPLDKPAEPSPDKATADEPAPAEPAPVPPAADKPVDPESPASDESPLP